MQRPENNFDTGGSYLQNRVEELEKRLLKQDQLEQMIEESEQRFKQILGLTYDGIVIYEKDSGKIIEANLRLIHKLKYSRKEVLGQSVLNFFEPEYHPMIRQRLTESLPDVYEVSLPDKDGNPFSFEISSRSCLYDGRKVKMAAVNDISYRKLYEKTLKESEERFRSLAENTNDSIILTDRDEILYANPPTAYVLGLETKSHTALSLILANVHPDDKQAVDSLISDVESGKRKVKACQFRMFMEDRKEKWIWSRVFPIISDDENDTKLIVVSSDITEMREKEEARKKMEITVRTTEEKYKVLTSLLPEIIIETDMEGKLTFVNLKAIEVFEYGSDFYTQIMRFSELISKEDQSRCHEYFERIIAGEIIPESEYTAVTKSGHKFPVTIHATRMYSNNELTGVSIVMFDISSQKYAERKALNYQENMIFLSNSALKFLTFSNDDDIFIFIGKSLSKIVPKSVIIVFSYDQNSNISSIRYISGLYPYIDRIMEILGKPPEDFEIRLPKKFKDKYLSHKTLMKLNHLEDAIDKNCPREPVEQIQNMLRLDNFYSMGMSSDGKLYGGFLIATGQDTESLEFRMIETFMYQAGIALHRKQIENDLVKAKIAAEESDRLKSAFLANMSHEVRTPLNGILGLAQLLLKSDIASELRSDYVKMIVESGSSLLTLIEDIMDVSKIEAKQMKIKYKPFQLNTLIDQLYSIFLANPLYLQKNASEKNIELLYHRSEENVSLISDPDRLQQIFVNLIGNALKFTQSGSVEFGYEVKKGHVLFHVKDTGIGIPKDKSEKIFERFIQVDNTLARKYGGSGLGLAISKGLVNLLNGEIWCESEPGKGSTFYFTIPYHPTTLLEADHRPSKPDTSNYNWEQYTILIVEDDKINFKVIEAMLRNTKVNVIHADTGLKAIESVQENPQIDLVLMDVHLPEISGLEATRRIRKIRPELSIVAQTANAMSDDKDRCIEAGCVDYISKPIDMSELFTKISKYITADKA
jgi:PAS domain S-box-containing protein